MTRSRSICALAAGLTGLLAAAHGAETGFKKTAATHSASGQFIISISPQSLPASRRAEVSTNAGILSLEAPWLAVSAERFKTVLWRELGLPSGTPWNGKIFIMLHTARRTDEPAYITAQPFLQLWNYRLELPDLISRNRYARALSGVILLELANRSAPVTGRSAELPAWLVDGLARHAAESEEAGTILSAPTKVVNSITQSSVNEQRRGHDPLAASRQALQNTPALTFDQLSWPSEAQLNGQDGDAYLASAQLFVTELLDLPDGPAKVRAMLARLPACENWQSAFFAAFGENFRRPLDVEKWWALRIVAFMAHAPGPQWSLAASCDRLQALLVVPLEIRETPDALPTRTEMTLSAALRSLDPAGQSDVIWVKLRELELARLRLAPQLAAVAESYRRLLADYLGEKQGKPASRSKLVRRGQSAQKTLIKKLEELDEKRRVIEERLRQTTPHLPE